MAVEIHHYSQDLAERFRAEKTRLAKILGDDVTIEHVGSSAAEIGGKNIVDILIGVGNLEKMTGVRDALAANGYFEGNDSHADRIFMASSEAETGERDFHIHISLKDSKTYRDFLLLRDYLIHYPEEARKYYEKKLVFAEEAGYDRKKYKALKAAYVSDLLERARKRLLGGA